MSFLNLRIAVLGVLGLGAAHLRLAAETLYNGIELPAIWPPRGQVLTAEPPEAPPYLLSPPEVIPIDVGRQLFVDPFLIERTDLTRAFHRAEYYTGNPVLKAEKSWELQGGRARAMAFSDGAFYDPKDQLFKIWYSGDTNHDVWGLNSYTGYAFSYDGVHWEKPDLDVKPGTSIVHLAAMGSSTVWLDLEERNPLRRFKLAYSSGQNKPVHLYFSPDGIHWGDEGAQSPPIGDRTTFFWNPFRKVWVASLRTSTPTVSELSRRYKRPAQTYKLPGEGVRQRSYHEGRDLISAFQWKPGELAPWVGADRLDPTRIDISVRPELYNLDAVGYESLMVGLFSIWRGQADRHQRDKPNEVAVGFSRDGFHWTRPFRQPLIPVSEDKDAWNYGNVQSVGGCCLVVGDRLYFYMSGRSGPMMSHGADSTGLATLRRDGFISMDAGRHEGSLTTRPVRFRGKYLFVNVDSSKGELRIDVLDSNNRVIGPFSADNCLPISVDNTLQAVGWNGSEDLSSLAGQPVKFRFHLRAGSLYSFWVSPDRSGASHGYMAAGGPGFTGPTDTMGSAIYEHGFTSRALN